MLKCRVAGVLRHRTEQTAAAITAVTTSGCEIKVRWDPPRNSVTFAWARWAMESSEAGVMMRSPVLTRYQEGIFRHAAAFVGVVKALVEAARWVAHRRRAVSRGRSEAKEPAKTSCLRYRSVTPRGASGEGTLS